MAKKAATPRKSAAKPKKTAKPKPSAKPRTAGAKAKPATRSAKKKPAAAKQRKNDAKSECVANLAAGARQFGLGLRQGAVLADPRKLVRGTGEKIRGIKFNRVTEFCKKEWNDLATVAGRLRDLAQRPEKPTRRRAKRASK